MKIEITARGNYVFHGVTPNVGNDGLVYTVDCENPYTAIATAAGVLHSMECTLDRSAREGFDLWRERAIPSRCITHAGTCAEAMLWLYNGRHGISHMDGSGSVGVVVTDCEFKLAVFIEGLDGCGKTELLKSIRASLPNSEEYAFICEMGSVATPYSTPHNIKADVLHCRAQSDCAVRDAHYTFAERWHQASMLVADSTVKGAFIDRSWLTAVNYQGLEDPRQVPWILDQGIAFNKYLMDNGWLPIYIVLTNHPFRTDETDSLERRMGDKGIIYRLLAGDPVDVTVLESDDVMQCCMLIEDKLNLLPVFGCTVQRAGTILGCLHAREGL